MEMAYTVLGAAMTVIVGAFVLGTLLGYGRPRQPNLSDLAADERRRRLRELQSVRLGRWVD